MWGRQHKGAWDWEGGGQGLSVHRKAEKTESIVTEYTGICFFCGRVAEGEHHLLFGNGKKWLADQDGLKVPSCNRCHNSGDPLGRVYGNPMAEKLSKMLGQAFYEQKIGTRDEFRARYGKSYL